ncbi:LuxR C-terminal-related transcriptional regulator [Flavobacterium sp. W22_SRS_FK3]|uniref:LuxR C-terminal-related transcriptional regulator n=1 Tax=Flavobacterium sp. W22_SRS_FK3 TaxID=3240275 RepID=UPI003F8F6E65
MEENAQNEVVIFDTAKKIWTQVSKNGKDIDPNFELEVHKKLLKIFQIGEQYHFIFNCTTSKIEFVHQDIVNILGYQPDEFSINLMLELIHPEDINNFINSENTVTKFFIQLPPEKILKYKVSYDFRIKKTNGEYIRILQQVVTIQTDDMGSVIRTLVIHTDISHLKKTKEMSLSLIGLDGEPSYYDVEMSSVFKPSKDLFTKREKEVIKLIIDGKNSFEIADLLCISKHTVDSHRKNILNKTNCTNTSELISKSFQNGWI